mgnify:CR=1 FL=1
MENRKEKRIKRRLLASIEEHSAITCDISANGLQISMGTNPKTVLVNIKLNLDKQEYKLKGRVKWIRRNQIKKTSTIGISIKDFPDAYKAKLISLFPVLAVDDETEVEIEEINQMFGV